MSSAAERLPKIATAARRARAGHQRAYPRITRDRGDYRDLQADGCGERGDEPPALSRLDVPLEDDLVRGVVPHALLIGLDDVARGDDGTVGGHDETTARRIVELVRLIQVAET